MNFSTMFAIRGMERRTAFTATSLLRLIFYA
jgi:hypothetical protein